MKNLKNKIENMKGITLISLVITVIILIILAGVTLNMLLGQNGIINRTKTAKEENEKATASETMTLKITECQMKSYAENGKLPDLQYIADRFCEDNDIAYVNLEKQKVGAINDKISIGENTSIFTKLEKYPYEFEINSSLQLASIDGIQVTKNDNDDKEQNTINEVTINITDVAYNRFKISTTASSTNSIICYVYIVDGELKYSGVENEFTMEDLVADTEYNVMVVAIDSEGNSKKSNIKKQKTSSEIIFDKAFLQSGSTYGSVTITESNYNGSAGLKMVGTSSNNSSLDGIPSDKIRWYKDINLTKLNNIEFYAKKIVNHGGVKIFVDDEIIFEVTYVDLPTDWTKYTADLTSYTGIHTIHIVGGYFDNTGSSSSETQFCDIKINKK